MNAQELIEQLQKTAEHHNVPLDKLEVNIRVNYGQDVFGANWLCEDLYDEKTNSTLTSVVIMDDADTEGYEH